MHRLNQSVIEGGQQQRFRAVVVVPNAWFAYAEEVYSEANGGQVDVITRVDKSAAGVRVMGKHFTSQKSVIIVIMYEDMIRMGLTQQRARAPPVDLLVWE